ncbi:Fc.00g071880.m01.CDS01 [Cosmosporella sp. VM-42]
MAPVAVSHAEDPDMSMTTSLTATMNMGSDSVVRHPSVGHRKFALYATRSSHSRDSDTNNHAPAASPTADATSTHAQSNAYADYSFHSPTPSDESLQLAQLPPLPISPRWDSLQSLQSSSRFLLQGAQGGSQAASNSASPLEPQPHSPLYYDATSNASESRTVSPTFPLASKSSLAELCALDTPISPSVENFSRPRKQSIRQPIVEAEKPRPANANFIPVTSDPYQELVSSPQQAPWSRPRGPSVSSVKSSATFASASILPPPTTEFYEPRPSRARATTTIASLSPRAQLSFNTNRVDNTNSPSPNAIAAPWMSGDELRSSLRSQLTESTTPGTALTERSSVLTKDSSVTSLYAPAEVDDETDADVDEPSLEDVMGMYEKGFDDDESDVGDNFVNAYSRPGTAASEPSRRKTLEAISNIKTEAPAGEGTSTLDAEIRMSKMIFTSPAFTSSVPHIAENYGRKSTDKRDSGKSLDSEPSLASRQPTPVETTSPISPPISPPTIPVEPEDPDSRDRYGFKKANQYVTREQYDKWNSGYTEYLARRRKKWTAYLKDNALMTDEPNRFPAPNAKTKRFVRKGIPPDWRGAAWFYYAGGPAILAQHSGLYDKLTTKKAKDIDSEAIERDLHRTFPDNIKFKPPNGTETASSSDRGSQSTMTDSTRSYSPIAPPGSEGEPPIITSLRRVLHAFSVYNPQIGYCQSLNFLAGLLLLFVDTEEQCFWLLNVITRIYLPGTHELNLEGSKVDLGVLMTELRDTMPTVWDKVGGELEAEPTTRPATSKSIRLPRSRRRDMSRLSTDRLPPITLCMTAWFMSCFIGTLPIETTLRVWDVFFYEGSKTLFRIALAIFKLGEAEVKAVSDPMEMFGVVQSMPRRLIDANALVEACFKRRNGFGHLSQEQIDGRREERRNKAQLDRLRQGKAPSTWNVAGSETEVRRKGTLFGGGKKKTVAGL